MRFVKCKVSVIDLTPEPSHKPSWNHMMCFMACFLSVIFSSGIFLFFQDLEPIGQVLGLNTFVNSLNAYDLLGELRHDLEPRSVVIGTYALCGFSHPAAIGIQLAALGTMAPERRADLARLAVRAFVAGTMACFLTACVAGSLVD